MICVTIACGSHTRMATEHQKLAATGIKLVELRLDFLRRAPELHRLIPNRPTATVITARREQDGGLWKEPEEARQRLLRSAIASEPEFVDLEIDIADQIPRFGKTRRIISYHNLKTVPGDLESLHRSMLAKDPDFIKIAVMPQTVDQMFDFVKFIREKNRLAKGQGEKGIRVVGICMGEMGKATRILAKKFGMPFTYSTFSEARIVAPGLLTYHDLLDLYHYESTDHETKVFGIIGNPLEHSLSPLIHNQSFFKQKINAVYVPFLLNDEDVAPFIKRAAEFDIGGLSVTIPHKVAVMNSLTRQDPAVEHIGACNTVIFRDGERLGYNTDYLSALSSIEMVLGGNYNNPVSLLERKTALVLGAGGAGMALAYGLKKRGAFVSVADINKDRAYEVSRSIDCDVVDWEARGTLHPEILANCTPVGMHPNINDTPFAKMDLRTRMVVFDAIYNPENTLLIKQAREKGCQTVTGLEMFVGQASLQFKLFTGEKPSVSQMRQLVREAISAANG